MAEFKHIVTTEENDMEVKDIMREHFNFSSRLRNKVKREHLLYLNGEPTKGWYRVQPGDVVEINLPDEKSEFEPENIPVYPVFEDDDLIFLNKQPGIVVHPTKGHPTGTIANALMHYMEETNQTFKIRFINRLDMDTSGILIVAKNAYCQNDFMAQMKNNVTEKRYISIVKGIIEEDEGTINAPIGRPDPIDVSRAVMEGGAESITHYKVLERFEKAGYTLVELLLETGRTHQIRVHMSHIGHPVLGDHLYGGLNPTLIERQALHAAKLSFVHPITHEPMTVEAPLPDDIIHTIDILRNC